MWWVMDGKCQGDDVRVSGRMDEWTFLECCSNPRMDPASVKKWTLLKCLGSVCMSMTVLVRSTLLLQTKGLQCPRPSLLCGERQKERERERGKILVTWCGCAQNGHVRCLRRKSYLEVEGIISAFQCRHLFASNKSSYSTYFGSSAYLVPANSGERYHAIIVYGASLPRPLD